MANFALIQNGALVAGPGVLPDFIDGHEGTIISNPAALDTATLEALGWYEVAAAPAFDVWTQRANLSVVNGVATWTVVSLTQAEQDALTSEAKLGVVAQATAMLRASDWSQMADAGLTAQQQSDMNNYRATLRAMGSGDVKNPTWPTCPVQEVR